MTSVVVQRLVPGRDSAENCGGSAVAQGPYGDSAGAVHLQGVDDPVVQARRLCRRAENCGSDKVDMPVVVNDRCLVVLQVLFLRLWTSL